MLFRSTVRAVAAPGHTAGHTVFVIEPDGVVVTGDIDLSSFGPYYGDETSSLDAFEATLEMVEHLEARHYVTYHHKGVVDGHDAFVPAVRAYAAVIVASAVGPSWPDTSTPAMVEPAGATTGAGTAGSWAPAGDASSANPAATRMKVRIERYRIT